jgi:hypothetical protein
MFTSDHRHNDNENYYNNQKYVIIYLLLTLLNRNILSTIYFYNGIFLYTGISISKTVACRLNQFLLEAVKENSTYLILIISYY